jgi:hypothetical protein
MATAGHLEPRSRSVGWRSAHDIDREDDGNPFAYRQADASQQL